MAELRVAEHLKRLVGAEPETSGQAKARWQLHAVLAQLGSLRTAIREAQL